MKATVAKRFKKPFQTDQRCVAQHRLATHSAAPLCSKHPETHTASIFDLTARCPHLHNWRLLSVTARNHTLTPPQPSLVDAAMHCTGVIITLQRITSRGNIRMNGGVRGVRARATRHRSFCVTRNSKSAHQSHKTPRLVC